MSGARIAVIAPLGASLAGVLRGQDRSDEGGA